MKRKRACMRLRILLLIIYELAPSNVVKPRRACAARVTVLGLYVCVCVGICNVFEL